nr:tetratricopeptide repeat protein [Nitrospirota bacterium]
MTRPAYHWHDVSVACRLTLLGLACVLFWAGCAGPRVSVPPRPPAVPDPTLEIQRRLIRDAQELHRQGRSQAAVQLLERWLRTYPRSPLAPEAHWWLGRSYEQAGDLDAALAQYKSVVQAGGDSELIAVARGRIASLERPAAGPAHLAGKQMALDLPAQRLPQPPLLEGWLRALAKAGVATLVLEAGTEEARSPKSGGAPPAPAGVYFRTDWALTVQDAIGQLIPLAHRQGMAVYITVNPWRMAWVDPALGWQAQAYDAAAGQFRPSPFLDLFHPAFQEYLVGLLTDLAGSGADGVLFRAPPGADPGERLSRFAREAVERDFGIRLDAESLRGGQQGYAPEVWRWLGWESRQTVKVLDRLAQAVRKRSPTMQVGLELHEETVSEPVAALVRYREDVLEARQSAWDFYVIAPGPSPSMGQGKGQAGGVTKAVALIGERRPIWMETRLPAGDLMKLDERLPAAIAQAALPPGIGLWYVMPAGSVP